MEHGVAPQIITQPHSYRDHQQTAARASCVRSLAQSGMSVKQLRLICPLSIRSITAYVEKSRPISPLKTK